MSPGRCLMGHSRRAKTKKFRRRTGCKAACSRSLFELKDLHPKNCAILQMNSRKTGNERDARVLRLYEQLVEIEQRLIPTGLHVFGRASELQEKADLLRMVASFDRPEQGARALPKLIAEGLGIDGYDELIQQSTTGETKDLIDPIVSEAIRRFCEEP